MYLPILLKKVQNLPLAYIHNCEILQMCQVPSMPISKFIEFFFFFFHSAPRGQLRTPFKQTPFLFIPVRVVSYLLPVSPDKGRDVLSEIHYIPFIPRSGLKQSPIIQEIYCYSDRVSLAHTLTLLQRLVAECVLHVDMSSTACQKVLKWIYSSLLLHRETCMAVN